MRKKNYFFSQRQTQERKKIGRRDERKRRKLKEKKKKTQKFVPKKGQIIFKKREKMRASRSLGYFSNPVESARKISNLYAQIFPFPPTLRRNCSPFFFSSSIVIFFFLLFQSPAFHKYGLNFFSLLSSFFSLFLCENRKTCHHLVCTSSLLFFFSEIL